MVKYGKINRPPKPAEAIYDPYELVEINIDGSSILARPFEFDSEPINQDLLNAFGKQIKPTKFIAACPHCGSQVMVEAVSLKKSRSVGCPECQRGVNKPLMPLEDPFRNPIEAGVLRFIDLDLAIVDASKISNDDFETAAERLQSRKRQKRAKSVQQDSD